jgi:hypothetical protein
MNRKLLGCSFLSGALLVGANPLPAQEPPPPPPPEIFLQAGDFGEGGAGFIAEKIELLGFEGMHGGKVVTGAPFSATATSETTQTLQDGTTIHRTSSTVLYRDSQGRSRKEVTLSGFGPLEASGKPRTMISISDPVAGTHYMLKPDEKVAHKMIVHVKGDGPPPDKGLGFKQKMQQKLQADEASGLLKKESLGTQTISGISAEGTRTTRTIPVGQIGNDKPIQVVFERWYSNDLQIVVKSTRTDPRFGMTTYAVTNLQRKEPAADLFTVPADYTVDQGPGAAGHLRHQFRKGPPPAGPAD